MARLAFTIGNPHFAGTSEVVACRHVELRAQYQVAANGQMFDEALVPVVQSCQRSRQAQGRADEPFRETYLQVEGYALEVVVVGFDLAS